MPNAGLGQPTDYDSLMQQLMNAVRGTQSAQVPPIQSGAPLVSDANLSQAFGRGLQPEYPATPEQKDMAMAKIGVALMQPRMPGQSVAGNIANAVGGGMDAVQAASASNRAQAGDQAKLASTIAQTDTQRQDITTKLKIALAKLPGELQTQNVDAATKVVGMGKTAAETGAIPTHSALETAQTKLTEAQAAYWEFVKTSGGATKDEKAQFFQDKDSGRVLVHTGGQFLEYKAPMSMADAKKQAESEIVEERKASGKWSMGDSVVLLSKNTDLQNEVRQRQAEYTRGGFKPIAGAPTNIKPVTKPRTVSDVKNAEPGAAPMGGAKRQAQIVGQATNIPGDQNVAPVNTLTTDNPAQLQTDKNQLTIAISNEKDPTKLQVLKDQLTTVNAALSKGAKTNARPSAVSVAEVTLPSGQKAKVEDRTSAVQKLITAANPVTSAASASPDVDAAENMVGGTLDRAREDETAAKAVVQSYGTLKIRRDPKGYLRAKEAFAAARKARQAAEADYQDQISTQKPVTGRTLLK